MKKLSLLLISALVLILAACGSDSASPSSSETQTNTSDTENSGSAENEKPDAKPVEAKKEEKTDDKGKFYANALKEELPQLTEEQASLSQESYDFIKNNSGLLPAITPEAVDQVKAQTQAVDIKLLNKNASPYYSTLVSYEGYVVQVEENTYENGETASWTNINDGNGNNLIFYMYNTTGDILEEDYVQFWGVPVAKYSYETLEGGYQNANFFFGAHIEKIQD